MLVHLKTRIVVHLQVNLLVVHYSAGDIFGDPKSRNYSKRKCAWQHK